MKERISKSFPLGQVVITSNAQQKLNLVDAFCFVSRHLCCDWGDLCDEDWALNNAAVLSGEGRIFSSYTDSNDVKFWIITEHNNEYTTVLLPEDY